MTLQQLRYITQIAALSSISQAARKLNVTQSCISIALNEIEKELGIKIFKRSAKGMTPTSQGAEVIHHAQQIMQHLSCLEKKPDKEKPAKKNLAICSQHFTCVLTAFIHFAEYLGNTPYNLTIKETGGASVIDQISSEICEIGFMFYTEFNKKFILNTLSINGIDHELLAKYKPHVYIHKNHPLSSQEILSLDDLAPYPCINYAKKIYNSHFYIEDIFINHSSMRNINLIDRSTCLVCLRDLDAYVIRGDIPFKILSDDIISRELHSEDKANIIFIKKKGKELPYLASQFLNFVKAELEKYQALS